MTAPTLSVLRPALSKMCDGDPRLIQQMERVFLLVNNIGLGKTITVDDILDTVGVTFSVALGIGRYFVDLVVMANVVGGTGVDGFVIEDASTATLSPGALALVAGDPAVVLAFNAPLPGPYGFASSATNTILLRGVVDVLVAGVVGFVVKVQGAPASVTLLAGSGLTASILREGA